MVDKQYMVSGEEFIELTRMARNYISYRRTYDEDYLSEGKVDVELNILEKIVASKTPIEPSDDAIDRIKKLYNKFIAYTKNEPSNLVIREKLTTELPSFLYELAEIADVILAPQHKPFNEAEIREILSQHIVEDDGLLVIEDGEDGYDNLAKALATLTPKYNSTDRNSIRLNSPEVVKKRRELNLLRDRLATKDNVKELYDE